MFGDDETETGALSAAPRNTYSGVPRELCHVIMAKPGPAQFLELLGCKFVTGPISNSDSAFNFYSFYLYFKPITFLKRVCINRKSNFLFTFILMEKIFFSIFLSTFLQYLNPIFYTK